MKYHKAKKKVYIDSWNMVTSVTKKKVYIDSWNMVTSDK